MATNLSNDVGLQLIINTLATVFMLILLITTLSAISGAHFNPAVTLVELLQNRISVTYAFGFVFSQVIGAISGVLLAHLMFEQELITQSQNVRAGGSLFLSEIVATAGLILVINLLIDQRKNNLIPGTVGLWIGAGYLFTASTSFANPAVTLARSLTNSFSGISPNSVLMFVLAQFVGAIVGLTIFRILKLGRKSVTT